MTNAAVAKTVGVHRVTLARWRLYHPGFQAALNTCRVAAWSGSQDRLRALVGQAMDVVKEDLNSPSPGRARLALEVLKLSGIGSASLGAIGPTDPEIIVEGVFRANRERTEAHGRPSEEQRSVTAEELLKRANESPRPGADPNVFTEPLTPSPSTDD